mmetsp:Transcript_33460/g.77163  ORF Transcript_33460/g.77163 Transcript_33460/m.77163 type:complete len:216 (-) Transcript_33460:466-1113(-)
MELTKICSFRRSSDATEFGPQRRLGIGPATGIDLQQQPQQISQPRPHVLLRHALLQTRHLPHVLAAVLPQHPFPPMPPPGVETAAGHLGRPVQHDPGKGPQESLHEGQVFDVVVGGEEELAAVELGEDAAGAPEVRGHGPAQVQDYLRGAVLARVDDGGFFLVVVGGAAEVDHFNFGGSGGDLDHSIDILVRYLLVGREEDVFRLQIRVDEMKPM